tara:strand:+ start:804 stop:2582 length:1779 start_codon:yes stop_codon:yes gene_type:complete
MLLTEWNQSPLLAATKRIPPLLSLALVAAVAITLLIGLGVLSRYVFSIYYVPEFRHVLIYIQVAIAAACLIYLRGNALPKPDVAAVVMMILGLLSVMATAASDHFFRSLSRETEVIVSVLNVWLLSQCCRSSPSLRHWISVAVLAAFVITVLDELDLWLSLDDPALYSWGEGLRNYLHIRHLGDMAGVGVVISGYLLAQEDRRWQSAGAIGLFVAVTSLLFSSGRASVVATLMALLVIGGMCHRIRWYSAKLTAVSALAVMASIAMAPLAASPGIGSWPGIWRMFVAFGKESSSGELVNSSGRNVIWEASLRQSLDVPWLGIGPDTYVYMKPFLYGQTPHNTLLQWVLDWGWPAGLLGFGLLLWCSWLALRLIWREQKNSRPDVAAFWAVGFGIFMLHGLVATTFYEPVDMLIAVVMLAMIGSASAPAVTPPPAISRTATALSVVLLLACLCINSQFGKALDINERMRGAVTVSTDEVNWLMSHPYSLSGFWSWTQAKAAAMDYDVVDLLRWGRDHAEYRSLLYSARLARYYWQKENEEEANKAFAAALANLPLISRSSALTLVCQLSGVLESRPECAEVYASLLEKIALRR